MRAWIQTGFGSAEEVRGLATVPAPPLGPGEVLVRVVACGLNRLDILQRESPVVSTFRLPHIGGMDIAGVVEATADPDDEWLIGRAVVVDPVVTDDTCEQCLAGHPEFCLNLRTVGSSRNGGLAELVAVPAANLHPVDIALDDLTAFVELASLPVAAVTAWHGLFGAGRIEPGETVVIPGAGSGLGGFGIQLAAGHGCRVIALVGGADKVAPAQELGADVVIDRSADDWVQAARDATDGGGADMVWDHVGGRFLQQAIDACRIGGRVVLSGTTDSGESTIRNTSVFHWGRTLVGHGGYSREEMAAVIDAHGAGRIRPVLDSVWSFERMREAEARLESGRFFGKVIVMGSGYDVPERLR